MAKSKIEAKKQYEYFSTDSVFNQFYEAPFIAGAIEFNCAEQYMMYKKAELFGDEEVAVKILQTKNPEAHKKFGREIKHFNADVWNKHCQQTVEQGNEAKFYQNEELKLRLFSTHPKQLVYANPADTVWGIGLGENDSQAWDKSTWRGTNYLGNALTKIREKLMMAEQGSWTYKQ